jgi:hypothetical protein
MRSYDGPAARFPQRGQIPGMRAAAREPGDGPSPTPIYDALYAEYRRLFRTLPGDRSGEDALRFSSFDRPRALEPPPGGPRSGAEAVDGPDRFNRFDAPAAPGYPAFTTSAPGRHRVRMPAALPPGSGAMPGATPGTSAGPGGENGAGGRA